MSLELLAELGSRFQGVDLQYRRDWHLHWYGPWRARLLVAKNERSDYRLTAYGRTAAEAVTGLSRGVALADAS